MREARTLLDEAKRNELTLLTTEKDADRTFDEMQNRILFGPLARGNST